MKHPIPEDLRRGIEASGARITEAREIQDATQYRLTNGPDRATLNVYSTGKVLEGGKESGLKGLLRDWRVSRAVAGKAGSARRAVSKASAGRVSGAVEANLSTSRVGTDEAGKGDYFGPLVVAGVRVFGREVSQELLRLGVRDSKEIPDAKIEEMAPRIVELVGAENVRVVVLAPPEYERRRKAAGDINKLLGELNAHILDELKGEVELFIVDEFARRAREYIEPGVPRGIRLEVRPRAEDDPAVAAASILARARFLGELRRLSAEAGFPLPKGATHVAWAARRLYAEGGPEGLKRAAKVHFGTTQKVLGESWEKG